jgi:DNA-binding transcriptional ArsR family regulator
MARRLRAQSVNLQAKLFRGFGDASRLSILEALRSGALTVTEIIAVTELAQSNASNHLACLRDCGLVTTVQNGRFIRYELSDKRVEEFLSLGDELLAEVAQGVKQCARYNSPRHHNKERRNDKS